MNKIELNHVGYCLRDKHGNILWKYASTTIDTLFAIAFEEFRVQHERAKQAPRPMGSSIPFVDLPPPPLSTDKHRGWEVVALYA